MVPLGRHETPIVFTIVEGMPVIIENIPTHIFVLQSLWSGRKNLNKSDIKAKGMKERDYVLLAKKSSYALTFIFNSTEPRHFWLLPEDFLSHCANKNI